MQLKMKIRFIFDYKLIKKFKMNIVYYKQGFKKVEIMDKFKTKYFYKLKNFKKLNNKMKFLFIEKSSFREIENIVKNQNY